MAKFIVVKAHGANGFTAHVSEGKDEVEAAEAVGGHFVHVYPDKGEESIVHTHLEEKHPLLVEGRPAKEEPAPKPGKAD